jgi:molybdopterin converting factor small subunit
MAIRVEFYGIARQRAGVSELLFAMPADRVPLSELLKQIAAAAPDLGSELLAGGRLHKSLTANLDGMQFISDPATAICDGQSLLILSADAGG